MTDAAPAPAVKAVKPKSNKPKKPSVDYVSLVKGAILELKERGGSSVAAIRKVLAAKKLAPGWEVRLGTSLKAMVKSGKLVRAIRDIVSTARSLTSCRVTSQLPWSTTAWLAAHLSYKPYPGPHLNSCPVHPLQVKVKASYKLGEALKKVKKVKVAKKVKVVKAKKTTKPKTATKPKSKCISYACHVNAVVMAVSLSHIQPLTTCHLSYSLQLRSLPPRSPPASRRSRKRPSPRPPRQRSPRL